MEKVQNRKECYSGNHTIHLILAQEQQPIGIGRREIVQKMGLPLRSVWSPTNLMNATFHIANQLFRQIIWFIPHITLY